DGRKSPPPLSEPIQRSPCGSALFPPSPAPSAGSFPRRAKAGWSRSNPCVPGRGIRKRFPTDTGTIHPPASPWNPPLRAEAPPGKTPSAPTGRWKRRQIRRSRRELFSVDPAILAIIRADLPLQGLVGKQEPLPEFRGIGGIFLAEHPVTVPQGPHGAGGPPAHGFAAGRSVPVDGIILPDEIVKFSVLRLHVQD